MLADDTWSHYSPCVLQANTEGRCGQRGGREMMGDPHQSSHLRTTTTTLPRVEGHQPLQGSSSYWVHNEAQTSVDMTRRASATTNHHDHVSDDDNVADDDDDDDHLGGSYAPRQRYVTYCITDCKLGCIGNNSCDVE